MPNLLKNNIILYILFTIHFSLFAIHSFSQGFNVDKAYNIWYFGEYAGLDFNSGVPKVLKDGKLKNLEGCAAISDKDGKLLFYTNGMTVWNKIHDTLKNGKDLKGHNSATQSAIIVPHPGNKNLYYIFTVASQADLDGPGLASGVKYNIVDISLDGGRGEIIKKNIDLVSPTAEKVTAVRHKNNKDIWVITHLMNNNIFHSYLVTSSGLLTTPVVSQIGPAYTGDNHSVSSLGYLKASFDGKRLAAAYYGQSELNYSDGGIHIFDFDNSTGIISNPKILSEYYSAYGVEFSPNCKILYGTTHLFPSEAGLLYQWNLEAGSASAIKASEVKLGTWTNCALQLGPDGKIYGARKEEYDNEYLSVINNPDSLGTKCNFVKEGLFLEGKLSLAGLPNFIQSYINSSDFIFEDLCLGDSTKFTLNDKTNIDSVLWNFGDISTGKNNISKTFNTFHIYSNTGTYNVNLTNYQNGKQFDIKKIIIINPLPVVNIGKDTNVCVGAEITIDAGNAGSSYIWAPDGKTTRTIIAKQTGNYSVTVTDVNNCINKSSKKINFSLTVPEANLGKDTSFCGGNKFILKPGNNYTEYKWFLNNEQQTTNSEQLSVDKSGIYWVKLSNQCGVVFDSIKVEIQDCELTIPNILTPNNDGKNDVYEIKNIDKYPNSQLMIFNRWGNKIYESSNYELKDNWWNGGNCPDGTYFFILTNSLKKINRKGYVTIVK